MLIREIIKEIDEGVKRNALYQKVGRMLGKGHDINAIKKRYKDIDDAHPGHIEKIVQALKDRNEIPGHLKRIKGSDVEEDIKEKVDQETDESGIMYRAGVKKYGKDGMKKIQSAAGKGASAEEIGKIKDQHNKKKNEAATAGATSSGNIASVANPKQAYGHRKRDKNGIPKAPQKKNPDGTAKSALDISDNLMGGKTIKR